MKKLQSLILTLFFYFIITTINAQEDKLTVNTKTNEDKSVSFTAEFKSPGTYTVILNFKELSNSNNVGDNTYKVKYSGQSFLTLKPSNKDQGIGYSFSYSYIRGELNPKYDKEFIYTLPYTNGKKVRVGESSFVNATYFGTTTPPDWKVYRFFTSQSDTVTAIRKGIVVSIKDIYDMDESGKQTYTSQVNEVIIEHADGSLATYRGFRKGLYVKLAQVVFPGSPIGLSSNNSGNGQFNISLMLTYLKSVDFAKKQEIKESKSMYGFITPYFYNLVNGKEILINNQNYFVVNSPVILQKEMTKKELKNLVKQ